MSKIWFKARRYGWGWTPITWEGWVVVGVYLGFIIFWTQELEGRTGSLLGSYLRLAVATVILLSVTYLKGEKPRWRWGDDDKKS